jgi:hypothetical protein
MLSEGKRKQICDDVVTGDVHVFIKNVSEAFQEKEERITEAEFYSAIELCRIELILKDVLEALEKLPGSLARELKSLQ